MIVPVILNISGEAAALGAAAGWVISASCFEKAGRQAGSLPVNVIRLTEAALFLGAWGLFRSGGFSAFSPEEIGRLLLSGFVGFFLGDLFLFRSFVLIGSRLAMLIMSLSPPVSALLDRLVFGTRLGPGDSAGMLLTMGGVALAVTGKKKEGEARRRLPLLGILLAAGGALGQSGGMILGKLGMGTHSPMDASFIRSLGGLAGFLPLILILRQTRRVWGTLGKGPVMRILTVGTLGGPVLGVSCLFLALKLSPAGVVSAISATVPIIMIPLSLFVFKEQVRPREILGAVLAVAGVGLLFLT